MKELREPDINIKLRRSMAEYLNKEEIKQWRSSLEKITLEEFAQRLGKTIKEEKETYDIVDMVMKNQNNVSKISSGSPKENVVNIAKKSIEIQEKIMDKVPDLTYKKPLTEREQIVLSVFLDNRDKIVYAKDLAKTLNLPTDYVYKYIKNLRSKIDQNFLENADKGGYRITIS